MADDIRVIPIACAFQNFHTLAYYIDAPEPALIDTGVASSPHDFIAPALAAAGIRIEDLRWVFLTHGHLDHIGGAGHIKQATGGAARVAIHEYDAPLLRSRAAIEESMSSIMDRYAGGSGMEYLREHLPRIVASEMEPDVVLQGGETFDLGGGIVIEAVHTPGHTPGSVTYVLRGSNWAFTGDALQLNGGIHTQFPSYESASAYRTSLERLLHLDIDRIHMGHPYKHPVTQEIVGPTITEVEAAVRASIDLEERISEAARRHVDMGSEEVSNVPEEVSIYYPYEGIAADLGYDKDPTRFPAPFFITLNGYTKSLQPGT